MTFPTIESTNTSSQNSDTSSHTIAVPSGVVNGDLVIAWFTVDVNPTISGWPAGWTQISSLIQGSAVTTEIRFLRATGSLSNFSITTSTNQNSVHTTYRISGHHTTSDPEDTTAGVQSSNANPPSHTATWGAEDNLWIVHSGHNRGDHSISTYPETRNNVTQTSLGSGGVVMAICDVDANASSRDPSNFVWSASQHNTTSTLVVRPAGGAAPARRVFVT